MYYYAYHGPQNNEDFDWKLGYGLADKNKRDNVAIGSLVIIIQKIKHSLEFRLCGIFKVVSHYEDSNKALKYRFKLDNISRISQPYLAIDDVALSDILPQIEGGHHLWSNFQKHFCAQGKSFQKYLDSNVANILLNLLLKSQLSLGNIENNFRNDVLKSAKITPEERRKRLKAASPKPTKKVVSVVVYDRNPDVVAEVLYRANGHCELCLCLAPFNRKSDGSPYLEVHHKEPLAENGDDTVENAIALCPNCHRKSHYG